MFRRRILTRCILVPTLCLVLTAWARRADGAGWRVYDAASGLPDTACRSVTVAEDGSILAVTASSLAFCRFDGYEIKTFLMPRTGAERVYRSPAGQLWTVSAQGLWVMADGSWKLYPVPGMLQCITLCPIRQDVVLCLLPDRLVEFNAEISGPAQVETLRAASQTGLGRFLGMTVGANDELWITGEYGLARLPEPKRSITAAMECREFIAPSALNLTHFRQPEPDANGVTMVAESASGAQRVVAHFDGEQWETRPAGAPDILFAWRDLNGSYWAAASNCLVQLQGNAWSTNGDLPPRQYLDVAVDWRGIFWLATSTGLIRFTPALWEEDEPPAEVLSPVRSDTPKLVSLPGLATNIEVACSLTTQTGDTWLGGGFGIAWRHDHWTIYPASDASAPNNPFRLVELPNGRIWCASKSNIWAFDGRYWSTVRSDFNRLNSLICTADGCVWAGSSGGIKRFVRGAWIENGIEEGLESNAVESLRLDAHGGVWARTARGWERFHPEADSDAPKTFIDTPGEGRHNFPESGTITLTFGGRDKWMITPQGRLLFSRRLDEGDWSPFDSTTNVQFSDLAPGQHYFQVRAMDRAGNVDPNPAHLEFSVVLPWYAESRLVLIATAGAAAAIFFAGLAFKRHRQLQLSYAQVEKQVADRTRQLELANRELLQSQKMQALGTLAAGIAHDFNNILSIIKGSAQIIEDNPGHPEKIRTRVERIKTVVDQGTTVVQAMLGFSRGSDELMEPCLLNPVVENTIKLLGDRFLREVEIDFHRASALPRVQASPSLVQQILLNFIFNAAEAMSGRKRIVITTAQAAVLPDAMALPPRRANAYVSVSVRDTGCGIEPENLSRVFEPFFTTKALSARRGTGLGLSVVYELAKKLEAGLAVESTPGAGSVFTLMLPASDIPVKKETP